MSNVTEHISYRLSLVKCDLIQNHLRNWVQRIGEGETLGLLTV